MIGDIYNMYSSLLDLNGTSPLDVWGRLVSGGGTFIGELALAINRAFVPAGWWVISSAASDIDYT